MSRWGDFQEDWQITVEIGAEAMVRWPVRALWLIFTSPLWLIGWYANRIDERRVARIKRDAAHD